MTMILTQWRSNGKTDHTASSDLLISMTKANIIDSVWDKSDFQKQESRSAVESLLEIIKHRLESGEDVLISRFGKFCVKDKKERKGRNPHTADDMKLRARRVVTFKSSGMLRDKVNGKK